MTYYEEVIGTNVVYKFLLPEAVCCCLRTCNCRVDKYVLVYYTCVPKFVVIGRSIEELWAQTKITSICCLRLFVVVYNEI